MQTKISYWLCWTLYLPMLSYAQKIAESPFPISVVTMDEIQNHRRVSFDFSALAVLGDQSEYYNPAISLRGQYRLGDRIKYPLQKMDINNIPVAEIERIDVLRKRRGGYMFSDALAGVVNGITSNDPFDTLGTNLRYFGQTTDDGYTTSTGMYMPYFTPKKFTWQVEGGYNILMGKDMGYSGGSYKIDNFSIATINGGITYQPCFSGELELEAGPALGIFENGTEFGFNLSLEGFLHLGKANKEFGHYWNSNKKKAGYSIGASMEYYNLSGWDGFMAVGGGLRVQF